MNFKTRVTLSTLVCIFSTIALLITCVDYFAMNRHFYNFEYEQLNTAEKIGISDTSLYDATDTLLDYMQDYRDDIVVKAEINGKEREVFDARETHHMVDVKNLYLGVILIRNVCVGFAFLLLILLAYDNKKGVMEILTYTYKRFFLFFALFLGTLITYAACDFTAFWTYFHEIFFTNDLWLLDPRVSVMINMFPEKFFFDMVFAIAISFFAILIIAWIYSLHDQRKRMKV